MKRRVSTLFSTLRHLKIQQVIYRLLYFSKSIVGVDKNIKWHSRSGYPLLFSETILSYASYIDENAFVFLNKERKFDGRIDWNYKANGMLWLYNLNYFEFLLQKDMDKDIGLYLIRDYIKCRDKIKIGYDPYPISLRNLFWIRFCILHGIKDIEIDSFIFSMYKRLEKNLEYHLLGNHLLENAFSLLFGAYYFRNNVFYKKAYRLLTKELNEQILNDGGHFELSPMYHQIMLYRLLDCINLVSNNSWKDDDLLSIMKNKAGKMLGWIKKVSFEDGSTPYLNDASGGIAPSTLILLDYGERLSIYPDRTLLEDSGYRKFKSKDFECIVDIGQIWPAYQPGHAHADTFNFVVNICGCPFIVDTGCSTYERGDIRMSERGTAAHNTVVINYQNSSDVWASHRVGKRARVKVIKDGVDEIRALHNGYKSFGIIHERSFSFGESSIRITDKLLSSKSTVGTAYFHLDYRLKNFIIENDTVVFDNCKLQFEGAAGLYVEDYKQAVGFNLRRDAKCIVVLFEEILSFDFCLTNKK